MAGRLQRASTTNERQGQVTIPITTHTRSGADVQATMTVLPRPSGATLRLAHPEVGLLVLRLDADGMAQLIRELQAAVEVKA